MNCKNPMCSNQDRPMKEMYKRGYGMIMKCPLCKQSFYLRKDVSGYKRLDNGQLIRVYAKKR